MNYKLIETQEILHSPTYTLPDAIWFPIIFGGIVVGKLPSVQQLKAKTCLWTRSWCRVGTVSWAQTAICSSIFQWVWMEIHRQRTNRFPYQKRCFFLLGVFHLRNLPKIDVTHQDLEGDRWMFFFFRWSFGHTWPLFIHWRQSTRACC